MQISFLRSFGCEESASALGVIYCLNGHGTFKQFDLPFGYHVRVSRALQRWIVYFCTDIRRAVNFPLGKQANIILTNLITNLIERKRA